MSNWLQCKSIESEKTEQATKDYHHFLSGWPLALQTLNCVWGCVRARELLKAWKENLNQKRSALPICVTWHWTFKEKTQSLFQLLCLPIWEEKSNPLRLLSLWYYWKADLNLTLKQWLSSFSFLNSIPAPRIHLALLCCHSHFRNCMNRGWHIAQEPLRAQWPEGVVAGEASLRKVPRVWELGHRNHRAASSDRAAGLYLRQGPGMEGLQGWVPQPSTAQLPAVTRSVPILCSAQLNFPHWWSRFSQLCPNKELYFLYTLSPHLASYEANCFTFPPMVNDNRKSKFYDFVTCKTCF